MNPSRVGRAATDGVLTAPGNRQRVGVVAIGASAGGLRALQDLVQAIPVGSGLAYVVIMHLDPDRESRIAELLRDRSTIPVTQVVGATTVEADHVYVIPHDHDLEMGDGVIGVRERGDRSERAPVDLFFRTLAEKYGPRAMGVILSGTGVDGTGGIRSIREWGGITVAQSPGEAEYGGMPASAIATGLIDVVLPASRIAPELVRLVGSPVPRVEAGISGDVEEGVASVFAALRSGTGHDFTMYKRATVLRRLERRLLFNGLESLDEYVTLLWSSEAERQALLRDLLISVSSFFRDAEAFEALAEVVPGLFAGKGPADTVRVWVVGCASGEEVYSLAILLAEKAAELPDPPKVQIFATDIDEQGYAWGREGLYSPAAVAGLDAKRLQRYFIREPAGYRITKALRERVLFAVHNVLRDPPFARLDLISCRNLFIYLRPEAQQQALETVHFALNPEGILFLGTSESVGDHGLFTAIGPEKNRIFRRNTTTNRVLPRLSAVDPVPREDSAAAVAVSLDGGRARFSYGALHVTMLEEYAEPSLVVDQRFEVVHLSSGAGRYLRLREGEPSRRVLDLASGELRVALRTALHQAFTKGEPTIRRVPLDSSGETVCLRVRPAAPDPRGGGARFALVLFEEVRKRKSAAPAPARAESAQRDVAELEEELRRTREQLEATSASHDHTVADLQTANEELRSINEEQKAATEELETGREEIQSINEELTTINQEHQSTIEELKRTNGDLKNLMESTAIATIFLDRTLRIRRFTPAAAALFNVVGTDQGRPLTDLTHRLAYPGLLDDVTAVLESLEEIEREVASESGEWFIVRINPYRSIDGPVDGVVLTFFGNTEHHRIQETMRAAKAAADTANEAKTTFMATLSHELRTPLGAILGYADILRLDSTLTEEQDHRVQRIKMAGGHLVAMIDELLSFTRMDVGRETVDRQAVDARAVVREAHSLMAPLVAAKGLSFALGVPTQPVQVETDVVKVRQILMNLCGNAVKYTTSGEVGLGVYEQAGRVIFAVSDTGIGIAPEHHARIFERFWQVDGGLTRAAGGLGVGLAAVQEYSQLLGGGVEVESQMGRGSTFRFWLPRLRRAEDVLAPA